MTGLFSGDLAAEVVEYSIMEALSSARKYKLDQGAMNSLRSEYALGVYCPVTKSHRLYTFRMKFVEDAEGLYQVKVTRDEIPSDRVAVLGLAGKEVEAQAVFDTAANHGENPASAMFNFVNQVIDEQKLRGDSTVDRPSFLFGFDGDNLTLLSCRKDSP